ncbi:TPA: ogr/Delta-like zinc finger family protein [Providencia rettgeri]|nr:ogr/Delta-like zinc finger family protein [Providencia rettgeri]
MSRLFKMSCPVCDSAAIIRKTEWKDKKVADLYCACHNVECGHTFVYNVVYSHALSPSGLTDAGLVKLLLERMNLGEKQMALEFLQHTL